MTSSEITLPAVSVVIPTWNAAVFVSRVLKHLVDQEGITFEIIVVDNGSHEIPTGICSRYEYVRLLQQRIPGPGPARNYKVKWNFLRVNALKTNYLLIKIINFTKTHIANIFSKVTTCVNKYFSNFVKPINLCRRFVAQKHVKT